MGALDAVVSNYAVDINRIFLIASDRHGLDFACRHAHRFAGVILSFPDNLPQDWSAIPLINLVNLPVYIDTSTNQAPPIAARKLRDYLKKHSGTVSAPEFPYSISQQEAINRASSWLSQRLIEERNAITWQSWDLTAGSAWWFAIRELSSPARPASVTATITPGQVPQITIRPENIASFAIDTKAPELSDSRIIAVLIEGSRTMIQSSGSRWVTLQRYDHGWDRQVEGSAATITKAPGREGPIGATLQAPFVIVVGTANDNAAAAWEAAAKDFAASWQSLTGVMPPVISDRKVTEEQVDGRNLILFGSPEENQLTASLLENNHVFLKQLFATIPPEMRSDAALASFSLYPADPISPDHLALVIIANSPAAAQFAAKQLTTHNLLLRSDYAFFNSANNRLIRRGFLSHYWEVK